MREINRIILHCSDTFEGMEFDIDDIREWHTSEPRNWDDVGYHYVIKLNGDIELGRDLDVVGSHTLGQNKDSIGICYIGGRDEDGSPKDTMTFMQDLSVLRLVEALRTTLGRITLHGHNEFSSKTCPSFDVQDKYKFLIDD